MKFFKFFVMWSVVFDDIYFNGRVSEFIFDSLEIANKFYMLYKENEDYKHLTLKHYSK